MPTDQPKRSSWAVWIVGALVMLPVLYVASIGPVYRQMAFRMRQPDVVTPEDVDKVAAPYEIPFRPLWWATDYLPETATRGLEWYVELWCPP